MKTLANIAECLHQVIHACSNIINHRDYFLPASVAEIKKYTGDALNMLDSKTPSSVRSNLQSIMNLAKHISFDPGKCRNPESIADRIQEYSLSILTELETGINKP